MSGIGCDFQQERFGVGLRFYDEFDQGLWLLGMFEGGVEWCGGSESGDSRGGVIKHHRKGEWGILVSLSE